MGTRQICRSVRALVGSLGLMDDLEDVATKQERAYLDHPVRSAIGGAVLLGAWALLIADDWRAAAAGYAAVLVLFVILWGPRGMARSRLEKRLVVRRATSKGATGQHPVK